MIGVYEEDMICKATNYTYSIMNLSRRVLDRAMLARKLCEGCAIPTILYCLRLFLTKRLQFRS